MSEIAQLLASNPHLRQVGCVSGTTLFNHEHPLICVEQMPLPGVVVFVHGVNSDGEWFSAAEEGLCKGLNRRLGRLDDQMMYHGPSAGQLHPASYVDSLTPDGFINPKMKSKTYIADTPSFSPVIHFRWGYKATKDDLKTYGANVMLNEQDYWGGGPFANGCSSLPDLWEEGLNDRLFLWITVQHLNSVDSRKVYATPPRAYTVLAALRLARLIESIRQKQADVPITVVCHSQGNMVGIAAAFLGDRLAEVTDPIGKSGRCVADAYVLANAPYSLVAELGTDSWADRNMHDKAGRVGRENYVARADTLKAYFDILRARADLEMAADKVDADMENTRTSASGGKPFNAESDRAQHGLNGKTYGRVTLYCCPHDQVISATTIQGFGWRGLSEREIQDTNGEGVFTQRVFASGYEVGQAPGQMYNYWTNDWRYEEGKKRDFWFPPSPKARFALSRALRSNQSCFGKVLTFLSSPILSLVNLTSVSVNADPDKHWSIPINAPALDRPFPPQAKRYGTTHVVSDGKHTSDFNEGNDPVSSARDATKPASDATSDDPYASYHGTAAQGSEQSEAAQRYEDHGNLRMEARRTGNTRWVNTKTGKVIGEDSPSFASPDYRQWHNAQITEILKGGEHNNPTNHSTIMTNPDHAEHALAYDIAVGVCHLSEEDWHDLRLEADWRFLDGLQETKKSYRFKAYFQTGLLDGMNLYQWIKFDPDACIPSKIKDHRDGGMFLEIAGDLF